MKRDFSGGEARMTDIEKMAVDTIRTLSMEGVQAANSGHPGTPMALAPISYLLFNEVMRYDPNDPAWPARDRFVLSCGHASMLLYSTLHLAGVKQLDETGAVTNEDAVPLDHIKNFRQLDSRCPGHPEHGHTSGVEMTTGPLGKASPRASAWRLPALGFRRSTTGPTSTCSATTSTPCAATAT